MLDNVIIVNDYEWFMKLLDKASDNAHNIIVNQMKINPDAIESLYG